MQRLQGEPDSSLTSVWGELAERIPDPIPRPAQVAGTRWQTTDAITRHSARSVAASLIARRLSSGACALSAGRLAVRKPPRHSEDTRRPAS